MKSHKNAHQSNDVFEGDATKRATKLAPNRKSGKERHHLYQSLESEDDDEDYYLPSERESALDYFDDGEEYDDEDDD